MKKDKIIVSSADSKYFFLLKELFLSLDKSGILSDYQFSILDTGLTEEQRIFFLDNSVIIKEAIWNTSVPKFKILGRDNLKTQVARAYLPDYFEDYKLYIWLDADMWLNDIKSFNLYEKGAFNNKLTIVPQSDRAYVKNANVEWLFGFPKKIKTINYKNISKSISKSLGRKYAFHSTLNAGAFAINDNVNIWQCFQKNIKLAAQKGRIFGTDQVALALSIYEDGLPYEFLPAYCNWMCEFNMPKFDSEIGQFVEPYIPNHPIALVHLAGLDDIRLDKNILSDVETLDGLQIKKSLRFNA
ncbi:glycosyl transferase [Alphaproteobacteria bacterium]|nr:glycosyl transferase [Alphaproteobacteria bacterium]